MVPGLQTVLPAGSTLGPLTWHLLPFY
jgi:hypothetical protein